MDLTDYFDFTMTLRSGGKYKDDTAKKQEEGSPRASSRRSSSSQSSVYKSHVPGVTSKRSEKSSLSRSSSSAPQARSKAQAARFQIECDEKEAQLNLQKAQQEMLWAERMLPPKQTELAEAEAKFYEGIETKSRERSRRSVNPLLRTSECVQRQSQFSSDYKHGNHTAFLDCSNPICSNLTTIHSYSNKYIRDDDVTQENAKYCREVVEPVFHKYDDKPEHYRMWKMSFLNAIKELNLSPLEEMALMTEWLGPESSDIVHNIRAASYYDLEDGLERAWDRLDRIYGDSAVVANALLKKIKDFPKITNKDMHRLLELSYILKEIQSEKEFDKLSGLVYFDSSMGVGSIVDKLPYIVKEHWIVEGSKYKRDYNVKFPPFTFFIKFIEEQAAMRNDPVFVDNKPRVSTPQYAGKQRSVTTRTSDYPTDHTQEDFNPRSLEEPNRQCPIHKKPHPLKKCILFRNKTLEERKSYLKEHHICFRCCGSFKHIARECKAVIKCVECGSIEHLSAMHPGTPPAPKSTVLERNSIKSLSHAHSTDSSNPPPVVEENLCHICMDAVIDCVLLECGHMVACTECGKRMNECPICRQDVIRVVHVFRP